MTESKTGTNAFFSGFLEPTLKLMNPTGPKDLTCGRAAVPYSEAEQSLRAEPYVCIEHTVPFPTSSDPEGFVYYQAWSLPTAARQRDVDVIYVHGLNDYGGRFSIHSKPILEQGFRIIALDLPSFGRSSGLHACFKDWLDLVEAIHCVVNHVKQQNTDKTRKRKVIFYTCSMGGMAVVAYAIKYPDNFDAFIAMAPLIYVEEESRPSKLIETVANVLNRTPLAAIPTVGANRGKNSSDPRLEEEFLSDPMTYHGNLRCSTGLAMRDGTEWLQSNLGNVKKPFLLQHGANDRVIQVKGSKELFNQAQTPEGQKTILIYEGCEHDMLRDPVAGTKVCDDALNWMITFDESN